MILICYIDDLLILAKYTTEIDKFKILLNKNFFMKEVGNHIELSGLKLDWSLPHEVGLRRTSLIEKLLVINGMDKASQQVHG